MRTLLVASQRGGVGTTTAAANLAAAAAAGGARVVLVDADPAGGAARAFGRSGRAPADPAARGGVWAGVADRVDVAVPFGHGRADPAADVADALARIKALGGRWDVAVVDAPAGAAGGAEGLLHAADELVVVQRADAASFKSLPDYLNAVRRARAGGAGVRLRGILVVLPEGVAPGGHGVAALRARFKGLLPHAVPFDPAVPANPARPVVLADPDAPAAVEFRRLAHALNLSAVAAPRPAPVAVPVGPDGDDAVDVFTSPAEPSSTRTMSSRTQTFYPGRPATGGRGPDLLQPPPGRDYGSPAAARKFARVQVAALAGSAALAAAAAAWFWLG